MTRMYLLIKRKNRNSWQVNRVRAGISRTRIDKMAKKSIKPGFNYKVLTELELVKFITKPQTSSGKRGKK